MDKSTLKVRLRRLFKYRRHTMPTLKVLMEKFIIIYKNHQPAKECSINSVRNISEQNNFPENFSEINSILKTCKIKYINFNLLLIIDYEI